MGHHNLNSFCIDQANTMTNIIASNCSHCYTTGDSIAYFTSNAYPINMVANC